MKVFLLKSIDDGCLSFEILVQESKHANTWKRQVQQEPTQIRPQEHEPSQQTLDRFI